MGVSGQAEGEWWSLSEVPLRWPEDLSDTDTIEIPGWGPANRWEWRRLRRLRQEGIHDIGAGQAAEIRRDAG